jgi:hypothetical protein
MRRRSPIEVRREIDLVEAMPCRIASMAGTEVLCGHVYLSEGMTWALSTIVDWKGID